MGSVHEDPTPPGVPSTVPVGKPRIPDYRNAELVSRLLAATPPYLYSAPLAPHAFFFSEMLRSFVQARHENHTPLHPAPPHGHKRSKKRSWNHHKIFGAGDVAASKTEWQPRSDLWNSRNLNMEDKPKFDCNDNTVVSKRTTEKPLELTINKVKNTEEPPKVEPQPPISENAPPSDLILPPPPPLWYPPLYPPPYGVDPLNFFIDLRVSGHIYDRKHKETSPGANLSSSSTFPPETPPADDKRPTRHVSAFSVPKPRDAKNLPINLCSSKFNMKYYDDVDMKNQENSRNAMSTHYVMQNLKKIYQDISHAEKTEQETEESGEEVARKMRKKGLELIVDYVKQGIKNQAANDASGNSSSDDDVIVEGGDG